MSKASKADTTFYATETIDYDGDVVVKNSLDSLRRFSLSNLFNSSRYFVMFYYSVAYFSSIIKVAFIFRIYCLYVNFSICVIEVENMNK